MSGGPHPLDLWTKRLGEADYRGSGSSDVGEGRPTTAPAAVGFPVIAVEYRDLGTDWLCPLCEARIPFPGTSCRECRAVLPMLRGWGLTSSLIGAVAAGGTLIAGIALLGSGAT